MAKEPRRCHGEGHSSRRTTSPVPSSANCLTASKTRRRTGGSSFFKSRCERGSQRTSKLTRQAPLHLICGDSLATGELSSRFGKAPILVVHVGLVVHRRQEQGTLDGISRHCQANEQTARGRQVFLGKKVNESMQSCAGIHGRASCDKANLQRLGEVFVQSH